MPATVLPAIGSCTTNRTWLLLRPAMRWRAPLSVAGRPILGVVEPPVRQTISTCVGCGSMREFATCEGICRERKHELVSGGDYDEVVTAAAACRARVRGLWPIVEDLAAAAPRQVDWEAGYESLRERTRLVLRESGPDPRWRV
jgi:hypothetical protein